MPILYYNNSLLLETDSFSFVIFKGLYQAHTSFKLNIVNVSSVLDPGLLPEPIEQPTVHSDTQQRFISQFMQNADSFSFLANDLNMLAKSKNYPEFRDHCHYTGKYRGAACSICYLKYHVPNKSLQFFITIRTMIIILL